MMNGFNGNGSGNGNMPGQGLDPLALSWILFEHSGEPGYYMLYRDLFDGADGRDKRLD